MRRRLERLLALAPWERRMLAELVLLLPAVGASLRLLGYKRTRDLLVRLAPTTTSPDSADDLSANGQARRIARLVTIAACHGPYRATCLRQSLSLWWLLRRRGMTAELSIGVRKAGGDLEAHAWVEHAGLPLGPGNRGYVAFRDFGSTA